MVTWRSVRFPPCTTSQFLILLHRQNGKFRCVPRTRLGIWLPSEGPPRVTILLGPAAFPRRRIMKGISEWPNNPKPVGPYSHCVVANGLGFISGQPALRTGAKSGEGPAA